MIGIDIQDTDRFKMYIGTDRMARIFSPRELDYIAGKNNAIETIAGIFCAKEAFLKAIGSGITAIGDLPKIQVDHAPGGAPHYVLPADVIRQYDLTAAHVELSISHTKTTAVAVCQILPKALCGAEH